MDIEIIRKRVRAGNYLTKSHAVQHALKEGFRRKHIVQAVLGGIFGAKNADIGAENSYFWNINPDISP